MDYFRQGRITRRRLMLGGAMAAAGLAAPAGWKDADLIEPKELAARLRQRRANMVVLHVGFNVLYRSHHIPNSVYAGPGDKPEGLERLKRVVEALPKDREIVIYCGCCPWSHCPNMKPAFALLRRLGFRNVKAVIIETNFAKDWMEKGYPVEAGPAA